MNGAKYGACLDSMRRSVRMLKQVQHSFPLVRDQLSKVTHMHQLGILKPTIYEFCEVQCSRSTAAISPISIHQDSASNTISRQGYCHTHTHTCTNSLCTDLSQDNSDKHRRVLGAYRNDIKNLRLNQDCIVDSIEHSHATIHKARDTIAECNRHECDIEQQIKRLKIKLELIKQKRQKTIQLQTDTEIGIDNMSTSLKQVDEEITGTQNNTKCVM